MSPEEQDMRDRARRDRELLQRFLDWNQADEQRALLENKQRAMEEEFANELHNEFFGGGEEEDQPNGRVSAVPAFDELIPWFIRDMAENMGRGAARYGSRDYQRAEPLKMLTKAYAHLQEHLYSAISGAPHDSLEGMEASAETHAIKHFAAAACNIMLLAWFACYRPEAFDLWADMAIGIPQGKGEGGQ